MMNLKELSRALEAARFAGDAAGRLMAAHLNRRKRVNETTHHDIKLELDVRCQKLITRELLKAFPKVPVLGEEEIDAKSLGAEWRWVVDPIDGTVNFAHGIPHACVSIALQRRLPALNEFGEDFETMVGLVLDPFVGETWTAIRGQPARRNGRVIRVSPRTALKESIVSLGFAKSGATLKIMLPVMNHLVHRVRKIRIMGAAALALVYVADGRFDAYVEGGVRLWDIAAGGLILECAGGEFWREKRPGDHVFALRAHNGRLGRPLRRAGC